MRALVVGLGSIGRRHARNWTQLGLGPLAVARHHNASQPQPQPHPRTQTQPESPHRTQTDRQTEPPQPRISTEAHARPYPLAFQPPLQTEASDLPEAAEYHDLDRALDREPPDLVIVSNPTSLHVATAARALQAGAHVLIEKPLGSSMDGVAELLALARTNARYVMVGYNLRFHPGLARLKALVERGAIGRIISARAEVGEYLPDWHPWEDYRHSYSGRRELGGGAVLTFSHELDALCWLLGPPRRITALAAHASSLEIDTEDVAEIVLQFESGALGSVHVDYVRRPPRRTIELVGEHGVLRWEYDRNRIEHTSAESRQRTIEEGDARFERNQMYLDELKHFVACTRGEIEAPLVDGEQGAAVLAIALAALRSSADGATTDFARDADAETQRWLARLGGR